MSEPDPPLPDQALPARLAGGARFVPRAGVHAEQVGPEMVLLAIEQDSYFSLNTVGARIFALLGAGADVRTVIATLVQEFDAPAAQIEADAHSLLAELLDQDLIEAAP